MLPRVSVVDLHAVKIAPQMLSRSAEIIALAVDMDRAIWVVGLYFVSLT